MDRIKNCPCCGSYGVTPVTGHSKYGGYLFLKCEVCGTQTKLFSTKQGEERALMTAIEAWNRRDGEC